MFVLTSNGKADYFLKTFFGLVILVTLAQLEFEKNCQFLTENNLILCSTEENGINRAKYRNNSANFKHNINTSASNMRSI